MSVLSKAKTVIAYEIPLLAVLFIAGVAVYAGSALFATEPNGKFITLAKEAILFQAVYDRPEASQDQINSEVVAPIMATLAKYRADGYAVIDTTTDADGNMAVVAIPKGSIDVTEEVQKLVTKKK